MNQLSVQNSNLIPTQQRFHQPSLSGRTASSTLIKNNPGDILQKRMSVVNLEAALGVQNSFQVDRVAQLGMAYRFNKASALRISPASVGQKSFSLARHFMR